MAEKLAEYFLQFSVQGLPQLIEAQKTVQAGLQGLGQQAARTGQQIAQGLQRDLRLGDLWQGARAGLASLATGIGQAVRSAAQGLGGLAVRGINSLTDSLQRAGSKTTMLAGVLSLAKDASNVAGRALGTLGQSAVSMGQRVGANFASLAQGAQQFSSAFSPVAMRLYGFVRSGIAASGAGQVLGIQMQELTRQIASLFTPQVQFVIDKLQALVRWFQALSGEQQKGLRNWGLLLGGITAAGIVLPKIVAMFQALRVAMIGLRTAVVAMAGPLTPLLLLAGVLGAATISAGGLKDTAEGFAEIGKSLSRPFKDLVAVFKDIADAIKPIVQSLDRMAGGSGNRSALSTIMSRVSRTPLAGDTETPEGRTRAAMNVAQATAIIGPRFTQWLMSSAWASPARLALGLPSARDTAEQRRELPPRLGGIEQIDETYRRIAQASTRIGTATRNPQERAVELLEQIYRRVETLEGAARQIRPVVV